MTVDLGKELASEQHRVLINDLGTVAMALLRATRDLEAVVAALPETMKKMLEAVETPTVHVQVNPTPINFNPEVSVEAPEINPQVHIDGPQVHVPPASGRRVKRTVTRDPWGRIEGVVEEEM